MSQMITNDQQLREVLKSLPIESQRQLGAGFVASVSHLCNHPAITQGIQAACHTERTTNELEIAYKNAKSLAVESYTACGRDADWSAQAEHFVAAAISACLAPDNQLKENNNPAWKAAMQARMARNCEMIMNDRGEVDNEANRQYAIAMEFLG